MLDENFFVEKLLPRLVLRPLNEPEMEAYRRPFPDRESRLPTLVWPRELPIEGEPADVVAIVEDYGQWMATSSVPEAIHQRRARFPIDRALARLLPRLAQSGRGIRQGNPFHSGGQPKRDRNRTCGVLTERIGALGRHFRVRVLSLQPRSRSLSSGLA